jgi:hypothetical protein
MDPRQRSDEAPTPPKLARAMLDLLPGEVWSDPGLRLLAKRSLEPRMAGAA